MRIFFLFLFLKTIKIDSSANDNNEKQYDLLHFMQQTQIPKRIQSQPEKAFNHQKAMQGMHGGCRGENSR